MTITCIRHPQTEANKKRIIYGKTDYKYTKEGQEQYKWILQYIKENYGQTEENMERTKGKKRKICLITSPKKRAKALADDIGNLLSIECKVEPFIGEMNFGIFEGLTMEEVKEKFPKAYEDFRYRFETTNIPNGDSYKDFTFRIQQFIDGLGQYSTFDEIILVTHGGVLREIVERILNLAPGTSWKFSLKNGVIIQLEESGHGYQLKQLTMNPY